MKDFFQLGSDEGREENPISKRRLLMGLTIFIMLACIAILLIKPGYSDRLSNNFVEFWRPISLAVLLLGGLALIINAQGRAARERGEHILPKMAEQKAAEEEPGATEQTHLKPLSMLISCPVCNKEISREAVACPSCGHPINPVVKAQTLAVETPQRTWSPGIAALLSVIIPGAGQMYKGRVGVGLLWLMFVVGGYVLFIIPGLILHLVCIFNAASGER